MKQSRIDFIKEAHSAACSIWKERIEKEFPKIFKDEFKVGDWIYLIDGWHEETSPKGYVARVSEASKSAIIFYGATGNKFTWGLNHGGIRKATKEEIESHLIAEAKKRGYKDGNYKCLVGKTYLHSDEYEYNHDLGLLYSGWVGGSRNVVYKQGQWAERIEQIPVDIRDILCKYGKEELKKYL